MNSTLPDYLKQGTAISDLNLSFNEDQSHATIMDTQLFGAEPPHDWCIYFEKADLARSKSDWQEMLRMRDEVAKITFHSLNQPKKDFSLCLSGIRKVDEALPLSMEIYSADNT